MFTTINMHDIVKITRKDSGVLTDCKGKKYKHLSITATDEDGNSFEITIFSYDISLGIEGVET